jgi:ABC-type transporter MlaC component
MNFKIKQKEEKSKIVDFIAEGVSFIETQRSEINSAINNNGIEALIADLEKKIKI